MKLLKTTALLALSAQAMTKQECMDNNPAGSAALGRCIKNANKMARKAQQNAFRAAKAEEQAVFHARAQAQKDSLRQLKDMRSQMQKTGQDNKMNNKMAKEMAGQVWAENRKQALLQFAFKRMGLRSESHVCRRDGDDVRITASEIGDDSQTVNFAIEEDDVTGTFWLYVKSGKNISLSSLSVDIATSTEKLEDANAMPEYEFWNVQVEEEYHGEKNVDAVATMASDQEFTSDNIWWIYCTERKPTGSNGQTFPMVMTEPDNDSEPVCADESDCLKAYFNHNGVKGWAVYEGGAWTSLPSNAVEADVCMSQSVANFASMASDASYCGMIDSGNCVQGVGGYMGMNINGACATLLPSNAEYTTIREVGPDGVLTVYYDTVNNWAVSHGNGVAYFHENADCSGRSSSVAFNASNSNDFYAHAISDDNGMFSFNSVSAIGIDCIDISNWPSQSNMNVVSDAMKWGDDSWVWIRLTQKTPFHATKMRVDYKGASNIGKFHVHSYQSDNLQDCTTVGGHYNPFNVDLASSHDQNQETYEIGDLSGKHGKFSDWGVTDEAGSKVFYDVNLPIWGRHSVAARGLVLHHVDTGARAACANFGHMCAVWDRQPAIDEVRIDYTGSDVWGYQVLQQRKGCPWCATSVKSYFRYKDASDDYWTTACADEEHALYDVCATGSAESKFHIHTIRDEVNEWAGCNNNGGHYNPQVGVPCVSGYQGPNSDLCELGDLNNKMGKLVIGNLGWTTSQETDLYAPLTESSQGYNFSNRSITVHAPSGARLTCGPTDLS